MIKFNLAKFEMKFDPPEIEAGLVVNSSTLSVNTFKLSRVE